MWRAKQCDAGHANGMADEVETYRGTVYPWEIDQVGHMNVQFYVAKFDEATWQLFAQIGMTPSYFRDRNRGMAAVQQNTTYSRELLAGDVVAVRSSVIEIGPRKLRFRHRLINCETGEEAAMTEMTGVHMDRSARKSCEFPAEVVDAGRRIAGATA